MLHATIFAGLMFLLVGFIMITLSVCGLIMLTRWEYFPTGIISMVIFVFSAILFVIRYSLCWHVLLRPVLLAVLFYLAAESGLAISRYLLEQDDSKQSW